MTYENPSNKRHAADLSRRANHRVTRPTVSIQAVPLHTNQLAYGCSFPRLTGFTSDQVERGPDFNNRRTGSAGITVSPPRKTSRGGRCNHRKKVAEREGFEPSIPFDTVYTISNRAPSANSATSPQWGVTRLSVRSGGEGGIRTPEER